MCKDSDVVPSDYYSCHFWSDGARNGDSRDQKGFREGRDLERVCVCVGECVTVNRFCPLWALVCQALAVAQRPGFYCLCNWLTCLIRLMGTDQGSGGVELMEAFGLQLGGVRSFMQ